MNSIDELASAIQDGDIKVVRQMIATGPSLARQKHSSGQFPIQIAKDKGIKRIEAILLLSSEDLEEFYDDGEISDFIGQLISELSEDFYSAGWHEGIEKELWDRSEGVDRWPNENKRRIDMDAVHELRALADRLDNWAFWDDNHNPDNVRPIRIDEWKRRLEG